MEERDRRLNGRARILQERIPSIPQKKAQKRVTIGKEQEVKPGPRKDRFLIQPRDPRFHPGRARPESLLSFGGKYDL